MEIQLLIDVKVSAKVSKNPAAFRKQLARLTPRDYGSLIMGDLAADIVRVRVVGPVTDLHDSDGILTP